VGNPRLSDAVVPAIVEEGFLEARNGGCNTSVPLPPAD